MLRSFIETVGSSGYKVSFGYHEGMYTIGLIDKYGVEIYSYSESIFVRCVDRVLEVFFSLIDGDIDKVVNEIKNEPLCM